MKLDGVNDENVFYIGLQFGYTLTAERVVAQSKADAMSVLDNYYTEIEPLYIISAKELDSFIEKLTEQDNDALVVLEIFMEGNELQMEESIHWDISEEKLLEKFAEKRVTVVQKQFMLDSFTKLFEDIDNEINKPLISDKYQMQIVK